MWMKLNYLLIDVPTKYSPGAIQKNTANSWSSNTNKPFTCYIQPSTTTKHCWTNLCHSWLLSGQLCVKPWHNRSFQKEAVYVFPLRYCTMMVKITHAKVPMCQNPFHVFLNYISRSTKRYYLFSHTQPSFLCLQIPSFMGSLWSHLVSQGTVTQCLLFIFWLDCRENNLNSQEEQCWLFKGASSNANCHRTFGMEWA